MLNIHVDADKNIITARPEGLIPASEFEAMGRAIDDYANEHDRMPGLVIHLKGLPHWQGLSAMRAHFEVVREHGVVLPRVAIVTDSKGLAVLPNLADIFVRARVRHFDLRHEDMAIDWAGSAEQEPEGYLLLDGFPDNVIAIRAVGEVTSRDYEDRLIPLVRKKARTHGKVRLMMQLGNDFEKYSMGAMWDDARLGLTNWRNFERIAIVSDIGWITRSVKMFAPLMPSEVAVFPDDGFEAASTWICEGASAPPPETAAEAPAPKPEAESGSTTAPAKAADPVADAAPAAAPAKAETAKAAPARSRRKTSPTPAKATAAAKPRTRRKPAAPKPEAAKPDAAQAGSTRTDAATDSPAQKPATRAARAKTKTASSQATFQLNDPAKADATKEGTAKPAAPRRPRAPRKPAN